MAWNYLAASRTDRMQNVADRINSKTPAAATGTASNGSLVIGTASFVATSGTTSVTSGSTGVLAVIALANADVAVSGDILTIVAGASPKSITATAGGTAANAAVVNNAGTVIVGGLTVGTSGTNVIIGTTTITVGLTVTCTAATITHAT